MNCYHLRFFNPSAPEQEDIKRFRYVPGETPDEAFDLVAHSLPDGMTWDWRQVISEGGLLFLHLDTELVLRNKPDRTHLIDSINPPQATPL